MRAAATSAAEIATTLDSDGPRATADSTLVSGVETAHENISDGAAAPSNTYKEVSCEMKSGADLCSSADVYDKILSWEDIQNIFCIVPPNVRLPWEFPPSFKVTKKQAFLLFNSITSVIDRTMISLQICDIIYFVYLILCTMCIPHKQLPLIFFLLLTVDFTRCA